MKIKVGRVIMTGTIISLFFSCHTVQGPVPSLPDTFYSPYTADGSLAEWASRAIQRGLGNQLYSEVNAFPDNRLVDDSIKITKVNKIKKSDRIIAERSALLCGGWDYIARTSDKSFPTADALAADLFINNIEHPMYPQAVAASMMVYPELRSKYFIVNYGGWREQIRVR